MGRGLWRLSSTHEGRLTKGSLPYRGEVAYGRSCSQHIRKGYGRFCSEYMGKAYGRMLKLIITFVGCEHNKSMATASTVIDNIPKLVSLPIGLQHLVQLESLEIRNCSGLRSLFSVFQHLTSLEEFSIRNCNELELSAAGMQIFQDYKSLRALWLETIPKCQHLPEWLQHLTNL
ncbi:hypothetical protein GOBAR_AA39026 [Gossypium barbadense]|uniref:Uncharacterized protein n=1 Tax=Gossypium barbadense TaxID=3634 RepID=A0A2P5VS85_GOSBA|nr:hypothetical protein GOBAR_AA39026 [Gossypium barbadense]